VAALAREVGAEVVLTTEKDAVRLEPFMSKLDGPPWAYLPMTVTIEPADAFRTWLDAKLKAPVELPS
jgi:hypothetical protein